MDKTNLPVSGFIALFAMSVSLAASVHVLLSIRGSVVGIEVSIIGRIAERGQNW